MQPETNTYRELFLIKFSHVYFNPIGTDKIKNSLIFEFTCQNKLIKLFISTSFFVQQTKKGTVCSK